MVESDGGALGLCSSALLFRAAAASVCCESLLCDCCGGRKLPAARSIGTIGRDGFHGAGVSQGLVQPYRLAATRLC
jgi:hypothetical protein